MLVVCVSLAGLYHAAVFYYQKGLEFPVIIEGDKQVRSFGSCYYAFLINGIYMEYTLSKKKRPVDFLQ